MQKSTVTTVATFGAAVGAMGVAHELQADIVDLTFSPGSVSFQTITSNSVQVVIDQVGGSFNQWNDVIGKTMFTNGGGVDSMTLVSANAVLDPGTFSGGSAIGFTASQSGTALVGFRSGSNIGWFQVDLGGAGGAISYLGGKFGTMGEMVAVPAPPAALALLALGAAGIRRKRVA